MSLAREAAGIRRYVRSAYDRTLKGKTPVFEPVEEYRGDSLFSAGTDAHTLIKGDAAKAAVYLRDSAGLAGKFKLIYLDPPFFTMSDQMAVAGAPGGSLRHRAYGDRWEKGMMGYLKMLGLRIRLIKDLLADDGLIFVHLDWHAVHYAKILMDEIFGEEHFVNEIIWQYKSGGSTKKHFSRKHDNILCYSKTKNYKFYPLTEKSYNRGLKPYRFKGVEEFKDEVGWYTMVNMKDVWSIDMVGRTSGERTGYATQKPEQLLERIIECSTAEGDLCGDLFCGSGTLAACAAKMGRRSVSVDESGLAIETCITRLIKQGVPFRVMSSGKKDADLKFSVSIDRGTAAGNGGPELCTVKIETVQPKKNARKPEERDGEHYDELLAEDPLSLIAAWSIDARYDGSVHVPTESAVRKNGEIALAMTCAVPRGGAISVKVTDILGNSGFSVFHLD